MNPKKNGGQNELANPPKTPQKPGAHRAPKKVNSCTAAESDLCPMCGWHLDLVAMHEKCKPSIDAIPGACYCSDRMSGGVPCPPDRCPNVPRALPTYTDTHDGDTEPNATPWPEEPQA
jgi:hypothetical protein